MRCARSAFPLVTAGLLLAGLLAASLAQRSSAHAATPLASAEVSGTATAPQGTSPDLAVDETVTVTGGPAADAVVTLAASTPGVPVDPARVTVDGTAAPAGTVSAGSGGSVTVLLGVGAGVAGPTAGGVLAPGVHHVGVVLDATAARRGTSLDARFDYTDAAAGAQHVEGGTTLPLPDLRVLTPPGSGEDQTLPLSAGDTGDFGVYIDDVGAAADAATLTVTLPAGLAIDDEFGITRETEDDEVPLSCTTAGNGVVVVRCRLGAVTGRHQVIDVPVTATSAAKIGATGSFTVSARADSGVDATPDDNQVTGTVRYAAPADLAVRAQADHTDVPVGSRTHVTVTVTNKGAETVADVFGGILVSDDARTLRSTHFRAVGFSGELAGPILTSLPGDEDGEDGGGDDLGDEGELARVIGAPGGNKTLVRHAAARPGAIPTAIVSWDVGRIAPGATTSGVLTLRAAAVGPARLFALAFGDDAGFADCLDYEQSGSGDSGGASGSASARTAAAADDDQLDGFGDCDSIARLSLRAVPAAVPSPSSTRSDGAAPIAETGTPVTPLLTGGLLAVALGALLCAATTTRRRRGRHAA